MAMEFSKLTLAKVFDAARSKNLGDPGRSIRMEKKADGKLEIGTWSAGKGHDWNPLKGYLQKKALVKGLEKRIDEILGEQGAGKALTKEVGAYKRAFFKNSLPKMTDEQVLDLETKVDERVAQKRQELSSGLPQFSWNIDQNGKIWGAHPSK
jgi:hypothetical protein